MTYLMRTLYHIKSVFFAYLLIYLKIIFDLGTKL